MYRLLIKTHSVTGLKYLCKTVKEDYISYKGSGKYWCNHLEKHGREVKTEVLYESSCLVEFSRVCVEYSTKFNVVESEEWANLIPENGLDGGDRWKFLDDEHKERVREFQRKKTKGVARSLEHCVAISEGRKNMSTEDKEKRKLKLQKTRSSKNYDHVWAKMSNDRIGGSNPAAKPIEVDGTFYSCISKAAAELNLPRHKITSRLKSDKFPTYRRI